MKKYIAILIIVLIFCGAGVPAFAKTISRNETVYVTLDSQGKPERTEVVTWLRTDNQASSQDVTIVGNIKNIKGTDIPTMTPEGRLTFAAPAKDIFYSGTTVKKLPVALDIRYMLNGKPMKRTEINGKSGRLEMMITMKNQTGTLRDFQYKEISGSSIMLSLRMAHSPLSAAP